MVLVVGGGTMGAGIAEVFVRAGKRVVLCEMDEAAAEAARARVERGLARTFERSDERPVAREGIGPAGEEPGETRGAPATTAPATTAPARRALLEVVSGIPDCRDAELAIEAVFEDADLKRTVLREIEIRAGPGAIVASNTSSLSIGGLAGALDRPDRFIGMHFFNPVARSSLVELVTGGETSRATVEQARAWVHLLGKEEIVVRDSPGFATSRLGVAIGLEAIRMLEEGVASAEDIDRGMVLGYRFPIGPLRLTDLVGLDVRLAIADHLERTLGERFSPPRLLREKVAAGELGKKTGQGFFTW